MSCEAIQERGFKIRTNQKIVTLMADSVPSREEWVKAIRKVMFKAQNMGNSVKVRNTILTAPNIVINSVLYFSRLRSHIALSRTWTSLPRWILAKRSKSRFSMSKRRYNPIRTSLLISRI